MSLTFLERWANFLCKAKKVTFSIGANSVSGWLFDPPFKNGKSIVVCHGSWGWQSSNETLPHVKFYAILGYKVFIIFFEDEFGNPKNAISDVNETLDAGLWLGMMKPPEGYFVGNVSLIGTSRGGYVALETFASAPNNFDKCVIFAGPTDMTRFKLFADYFDDLADPLTRAVLGDYKKPKSMLLLYGDKDRVVPFYHGEVLAEAIGIPFEPWKNEGHYIFRNPQAQRKCHEFIGEI